MKLCKNQPQMLNQPWVDILIDKLAGITDQRKTSALMNTLISDFAENIDF